MIRATSLLLAALSFATPSLAAAPPAVAQAPSREPLVVRIGYTTFDTAEKIRSDLRSVEWYLGEITRRSQQESWKRPLQFELVRGNYYQIWSWFRSGQIDAAIVSPFMAMLLERDSQAHPVLEFSE